MQTKWDWKWHTLRYLALVCKKGRLNKSRVILHVLYIAPVSCCSFVVLLIIEYIAAVSL